MGAKMDIVKINGASVARINYKNKPVITLRMIDELHGRVDGTARRTFSQHKEYLIEGEDFLKCHIKNGQNSVRT
jgi:ORF6N domain.